MRVSVSVLDAERWFGGDHAAVTELVALADRKGIDQISAVDHVVMGPNTQNYPYGKFAGSPDYPWLEPLVQLGAYASVTKTIKLGTGIIISPLRPAALLAKQLATLDVLSRGRAEIGIGVGWQQEEYIACGVPWEDRFEHMIEQVRVCRLLWREAPAAFKGVHTSFEQTWCMPQPVRKDIPLYFGIGPLRKNIERIAEHGDGWLPMAQEPEQLAGPIAAIRAAFEKRGRDPASLEVRASLKLVFNGGRRADWDATLAQVPAMQAAGVTTIRFPLTAYCRAMEDCGRFLERIVQIRS
jgi:probable F420-dependent oxidoreductase